MFLWLGKSQVYVKKLVAQLLKLLIVATASLCFAEIVIIRYWILYNTFWNKNFFLKNGKPLLLNILYLRRLQVTQARYIHQ